MSTLEIPERGIGIEIPDHWDEMTGDQVQFCLKQALSAIAGLIMVREAKVRCFYKLSGIKRDWRTVTWERVMPKELVDEKNGNVFLLSDQLMGFLFTESESGININYSTVLNHFPEVMAVGKRMFGPADMLADLTFGEFRTALEEMNEFFEGRDEHQLSRFLACLYRPQRKGYADLKKLDSFDGQRRQPFNRALIETNARILDKAPLVFRQAVLLWFTFTIDFIQREDITLGGAVVNFSRLFPKLPEGQGAKKGSGWSSILFDVAKEGPFGDLDKTDKVGLFDMLLFLKQTDDRNRELKRKSRK